MTIKSTRRLSVAELDKYLAAIDEGIEAADAGHLVDHDKVVAWVRSWGRPGELPAPKCG